MYHKKFDTASEDAMVAEYVSGLSMEAVGEKHGCSFGGVRKVLVRRGIARRPRGAAPNPVTPTKFCSSCGAELLREQFYGQGKNTSECPTCISEKNKDRYHGDDAFRLAKIEAVKRRTQTPGSRSRSRRHGWTTELFAQVWEQQNGCCAICKKPLLKKGHARNAVNADHDHSTNSPRGLLCAEHNRGLGCFQDSPDLLEAAAVYVRSHKVLNDNLA